MDEVGRENPSVASHGSLSMTVNLHAVGVSRTDGVHYSSSFALHTPQQMSPLDVCLVCDGVPSSRMVLTCECFEVSLCKVGVYDVYCLRDNVENNAIARQRALWSEQSARKRQAGSTESSPLHFSSGPEGTRLDKAVNTFLVAGEESISSDLLTLDLVSTLTELCGYDVDVLLQFKSTVLARFEKLDGKQSGDSGRGLSEVEVDRFRRWLTVHKGELLDGIVTYFDGRGELAAWLEKLLSM